jgi:KUP system potassium uptake protein
MIDRALPLIVQSVNAFSSTEAELIALSEDCSWVLWAKHWLESQGHEQGAVTIFQDNTSVPSILKKGPSAELRTRYLSIRYFFTGDIIKRNEAVIHYCPTDDILADLFTKPLVGARFQKLRDAIITLEVN